MDVPPESKILESWGIDVPLDLKIPDSIAQAPLLSTVAVRTKRTEIVQLMGRFFSRPFDTDFVNKSFDELGKNWQNIKKDVLARRLALHDVGERCGLPMIEQVQYYETYLHRNPHQSNREEYLDDLSARGYFPAATEERALVHAAHQNYRDALSLYRGKLGLPPDFVPHLQSWRLMDVPVDLEIPLFLGYMKALPPALIRTKRIERISLEFNYLFRRDKRREKVQEFRANWANAEKDTLATNLSLCDVREKYGREMTSEVIYFRSRLAGTESPQTTLLAKSAEGEKEEIGIYDAHQFFEAAHDHYRARLGLPREKIRKPIMIPRRQLLPSIFK